MTIMKRIISILCISLFVSACFIVGTYGASNTPVIKLDSSSYIGMGARPIVTLQNSALNKSPKSRDSVEVTVCSTSDTSGITLKLVETAPDTGEFTADFGLVNAKSNDTTKVLKVQNDDNITVSYNEAAISFSSKWSAATGTVKLHKKDYVGLKSNAFVTITDKDLNLRSGYIDTAKVRIFSDTDINGIILTAYENSTNSGMFLTNFGFTVDKSDIGDALIKISPSDNVYAEYLDEMDETGAVNVKVVDASSFKFAEASIKTSAANDEGAGNVLTITINEPDANNPNRKDRIMAKVSSGNGAHVIAIRLDETGTNTSSFRCRLYFNEEKTSAVSLRVKSNDVLSIKYIDPTVPQGGSKEIVKEVKWEYISTLLKTDKTAYSGYIRSAAITLIDYNLNYNEEKIDTIDVRVTTSDEKGIKLELGETGSNTGEFKGTLFFGKNAKPSAGVLKVVNNETITINFTNPKRKDEFAECNITWSYQDGMLSFDKPNYIGNNAPVKVTLNDWDAADNDRVKESIRLVARLKGGGREINVPLEETGKDSGRFTGTFYINGTGANKPSISLNQDETFEVIYVDENTTKGKSEEKIASAVWGGVSKAKLTLNEQKYKGYGEFMVITLTDPDQNKDSAARDQVTVQLRTRSGLTSAIYTLTETGVSNGEFNVVLTFTEESSTPTTIRVAPNDEITVSFLPKGVSTSATFTKE